LTRKTKRKKGRNFKKGIDFMEKSRYNLYLREIECRTGGVTMPNIKSSKKDVIRSRIAYEKNKANKSEMKTVIKKYEAALAGGDKAVAEVAFKDAVQIVDKAVSKGILHKNTAARKKSSMALRLNKLA